MARLAERTTGRECTGPASAEPHRSPEATDEIQVSITIEVDNLQPIAAVDWVHRRWAEGTPIDQTPEPGFRMENDVLPSIPVEIRELQRRLAGDRDRQALREHAQMIVPDTDPLLVPQFAAGKPSEERCLRLQSTQ